MRGATRDRMLREMADALEALTADRPLVLVLEDFHWSDHATLDLIAWLARRREPARLLLLITYRPIDVIVRAHPLRAVASELALHGLAEGRRPVSGIPAPGRCGVRGTRRGDLPADRRKPTVRCSRRDQ
jgi:hypothetical protein